MYIASKNSKKTLKSIIKERTETLENNLIENNINKERITDNNRLRLINDERDLLNTICPNCNKDYQKVNYRINRRRQRSMAFNTKIYKDCSTINFNARHMKEKSIKELSEYLGMNIISRKCVNCKEYEKLNRSLLYMITNKYTRNILNKIYSKEDTQDFIKENLEYGYLIKENNKLKVNTDLIKEEFDNKEYMKEQSKIYGEESRIQKSIEYQEKKNKEYEERLRIRKQFEDKEKEEYLKQFKIK